MDRSRSRRVGRPVVAGLAAAIRLALLVGTLAGPWLGGAAMAQAPARGGPKFNPDDSEDAQRQLLNAANHARDRQWSEVVDIYQRVIDRYGDKVIKVPKDEPGAEATGEFLLYMDGRRFCHRRLAQMPPEAREAYRNRMDQLARRWYEEGAARRDPALLHRVVDQAFCSSWGDDALELLGDLAFQDGRFGDAVAAYSRLVPDRADDPFALVHPDPSVDLARVAAKKWLCRAASDRPPGPADLAEFARRFPDARGSLAGRKGAYSAILADSIAHDRLETAGQPDGRWPTFAGSPRRTRVLPGPIDVGQVQWRVETEKVASGRGTVIGMRGMAPTTPQRPEALLAYHPIVLGDQVLISDGSRVLAYNLSDRPSGSEGGDPRPVTPAWKHDPDGGFGAPQATRPSGAIPRYTLTAFGHRIYARMGSGSPERMMGRRGSIMYHDGGPSSIVALDWETQGKLLWQVKSSDLELPHRPAGSTRTITFEGTPVADGRYVYAAVTDRNQETMLYVACFDAETGNRHWIRYLGTARLEAAFMPGFGMAMFNPTLPGDYRHRLLTLDGSTLYYLTNLGAVIALDAETGATNWVATYPRQGTNRGDDGSDRDLNPAVVDDGRVLVAPSDADAIFAFDAGSGRLLWKTEPIADDIKLSHVLGVAKGRLIVTGNRVVLYNVATGKLEGAWPDKALEGYGRGLLAGDLIYWPTRTEIQVLDQRTGLRSEPPIKLQETYHTTGGNLAAGDGYLIVAQADGLVVFCQNSRLIDRYREEIAGAPERAASHYRLARAAEAIGREEMALEAYRQAIRRARPDDSIDGVALAGAARDHLFRLLMRQASRLRRERRWDRAIEQIEAAVGYARADAERLEARLLLADIHVDADHPREAVDALERILLDARLRPLPVAADDGRRTIRADLMVADRLGAILRRHGREPYATYDRRAAELLARGGKARDPHLLAELCRDYPAAEVVPSALLELGRLDESAGRLAEATHAYKRLLAVAPDDERRALATWSMARVYEARRLYVSARDTYLDLVARYPKVRLEAGGATVAERVAEKLAREPYLRLVVDRRRPIAPPMVRRWHWTGPTDRVVRALGAEGVAPSLEAGRIVLGDRDRLGMLDAAGGSARWSAELGAPAEWAGYLEDKLIAAGGRQIVAVDLASGAVQWRYRPGSGQKDVDRPDPFAPAGGGEEHPERSSRALHGFRLAKGRVFCLAGPSELVALDGDTGAVDWSFSATPGPINPNVWIGADRVVLQVRRPNQLLVLRTEDGQPVARAPLGDADLLDRPPVPLDDDSALVVLDPRTVKKLDLNTGQIVWEYRESEDMPTNGPPRAMGGGDLVLVLHEGRTLIRLDPTTGTRRWSCPLSLEDLNKSPGAIAFDDRRIYCISRYFSDVTLRAISLADGVPGWESSWVTGADNSKWSIALADEHVVAYPERVGPGEGAEIDAIPVMVRRRETGALVQRLLFPGDGKMIMARRPQVDPSAAEEAAPTVLFGLDHLGAVMVTPRGVWGLGVKESVDSVTTIRGASR